MSDPIGRLSPVVRHAPAKLNLTLAVTGRRDDGYHALHSVFVPLALGDRLSLAPIAGHRDSLHVTGLDAGPPEDNLVFRALAAVRAAVGGGWAGGPGPAPALAVRLDKRIPVAAGLAGGSSDAAATVDGSLEAWGAELDGDARHALAARLGSDVPSQVEPGHWVVTGTGERLEPIELAPADFVLVPDARGLTAAEVYGELDRSEGWRELLDPEPLRGRAGSGPQELAAVLENDLEPPARTLRPEIGAALDALRGAGALGVAVSGSGPTCFGLFDGPDAARAAWEAIPGSLPTRLRRR